MHTDKQFEVLKAVEVFLVRSGDSSIMVFTSQEDAASYFSEELDGTLVPMLLTLEHNYWWSDAAFKVRQKVEKTLFKWLADAIKNEAHMCRGAHCTKFRTMLGSK